VHSITAPPFLVRPCIHCRAFLFSFGRCISSPRRILFVRPAHPTVVPLSLRLPVHLPPIHQFGVASFAGAFAADPPIWCCFVCRRIRRRSTDLVLLRLPAHSPPIHRFGVASFAGAFLAEPPPIWRCFTWPAHSSPSRHQFGVVSLGRRIPRRAATNLALFHLAGAFPADLVTSFAGAFAANPPIWCCSFWPAHPLAVPPSLFLAGASPRRATIALFGRRIPSPCHHRSFWPAHPLAVPQSLFLAGASPRRATITIFCRYIPLPCPHCLPTLGHPIAAHPSPISVGASHRLTALSISAGASHRRTSIAYLGLRAHSMPHCTKKYQSRDILHASASAASILM
jgi:hypothetical protein